MTPDAELLRLYAEEGSEAAFAETVNRHLPLVYGTAYRRTGNDAHRAADVAQQVFISLARNARKLVRHPALAAWLHAATRNAAVNVMISEQRRRSRETESIALASGPEHPADWERLRPVLDNAIDELSGNDRTAIVLRFLQQQPFAEIGTALNVSEAAARMRTDRALEKLRRILARHGIDSSIAALGLALAHQPVVSAPAGLAAVIATESISIGSAAATTLLSAMSLKFAIISTLGILAAFGIGTYAGYHSSRSAALKAARESAEATKGTVAAPPPSASSPAAVEPDAPGVTPTPPAPAQSTAFALPANRQRDEAERERDREQLRRRYQPFLQRRGIPPAQAERFIESRLLQKELREDIQAAVRANGVAGNDPEVVALRARLTEPLSREQRDILGEEGYREFGGYEMTSFYRLSFVEPMASLFQSANATLSAEQEDDLVMAIAANGRGERRDPSGISNEFVVDWPAVVRASEQFLSPAQLRVVQIYAERRSAK